jgi:hypothetical protein
MKIQVMVLWVVTYHSITTQKTMTLIRVKLQTFSQEKFICSVNFVPRRTDYTEFLQSPQCNTKISDFFHELINILHSLNSGKHFILIQTRWFTYCTCKRNIKCYKSKMHVYSIHSMPFTLRFCKVYQKHLLLYDKHVHQRKHPFFPSYPEWLLRPTQTPIHWIPEAPPPRVMPRQRICGALLPCVLCTFKEWATLPLV